MGLDADGKGLSYVALPRCRSLADDHGRGLGPGFRVLVNAVSGRTTDIDYSEGQGTLSGSDFNGLKALPSAIATEMPLDLVIVFLGTNDLRSDVNRTPEEIAAGAMRVAALVAKSTGAFTIYPPPRALVVVPLR